MNVRIIIIIVICSEQGCLSSFALFRGEPNDNHDRRRSATQSHTIKQGTSRSKFSLGFPYAIHIAWVLNEQIEIEDIALENLHSSLGIKEKPSCIEVNFVLPILDAHNILREKKHVCNIICVDKSCK